MVLDLHHVPGRLRVCLAKLKGDSRAIVPLHSELLSIPGIESASISAQTGSVTIFYRRSELELDTFWATLRRLGYLDEATQAGPSSHSARSTEALGASAASALGDALVSAVVKHFVDRSALSLIRLLT
ncbi:MAG: HMA2 domain-containing protein [Methylocystis sp.]|jgi:hypothetical protein